MFLPLSSGYWKVSLFDVTVSVPKRCVPLHHHAAHFVIVKEINEVHLRQPKLACIKRVRRGTEEIYILTHKHSRDSTFTKSSLSFYVNNQRTNKGI